jgi:hypothetical protein
MTKLFILLTGYLLLGQPTYSVAQKDVQLQNVQLQDVQLRRCCEKIMKVGPSLLLPADRNGKMRFRLLGIYSHGPTLFFLLRLNNRSPLDYDIDSIRFCIADRDGVRQLPPPRVLLPVYIYDSTVTVPGYRRATTIYAVQRFTLPPGRQLQIIVRERNGGRHLLIRTSNGTLEKARRV